jgi:hypothetical protein
MSVCLDARQIALRSSSHATRIFYFLFIIIRIQYQYLKKCRQKTVVYTRKTVVREQTCDVNDLLMFL